eukprot:CAMPEP_0178925516 /NCGR_PEP_ID=MMETSP0786-20121207/17957_1 /TAXON_ID=186022 /ORGANISM="Thalassionema frauenfeldii, Strain CCMP 1798" /LENGTH=162 /DNA_ID=CAMNT_0020600409 /DNA_START=533 /DNA_END=1021 /DNA_ORIENTATION=-
MAPLAEMTDCMNLPATALPAEKELMCKGGILYLEVLELKEEIAVEKEELDYLHNQMNEALKTRNGLREQNKAKKSINDLYSELEELRQLLEDLDEDIEMKIFETKTVKVYSEDLRREIKNTLRKASEEKRPSRRASMTRRSSRYFRHQKRRQSAPLVSAPSA